MKRRRAPFGRYLPAMAAELFLPHMPEPSATFVQGLKLAARTRPYLTQKGDVTVRLVFRERDGDQSAVVSFPLRGALGADLRDALQAVIGPKLRLRFTPMPGGPEVADHAAR